MVQAAEVRKVRRKATRKRKATLVDVAQLAKVSTATVSRIFGSNGVAHVAADTRERILAAAELLHYTPNILARSFRSQRSHAIGLLVSNMAHPHIVQAIEGVEKAAQEAGYVYVLSNSDDALHRENLCRELFGQNRIDGAVLIGLPSPQEEDTMISSLVRDGIPVALIGRIHAHGAVPCVSLDNIRGGRMATEHLLGLGHRRIAYVAGGHYHSDLRLKGYRQALAAAGIEEDPALVIGGEGRDAAEGYFYMKTLLSRGAPPTGAFCFNDKMAFGVLKALHECGLSVPRNCAVVGFDNIEYCQYSVPTLTSVSQPSFQMGYAAGKNLLALLAGNPDREKRATIFDPNLVVRESTDPSAKPAN
jgi:DNA-binding LacI/PurR family transcriptional regulator